VSQRTLTYAEAIREATEQAMARDPAVRVFGICIDDHRHFYGTLPPVEAFGSNRIRATPLSEDGITGAAIGAAMAGGRIVLCHERFEYVLLTMNQLVNYAAKAHYMFGGKVAVPIVVRAVIGRSWGQGAQHSQAFHSFFMHVPGFKVVAPTTPYDAKGCLLAAIHDPNPVIFVEHRLLHHKIRGYVPEEPYLVPFGRARLLSPGSDITILGISHMAIECFRAAQVLDAAGISAEVIDPVSLVPLDLETIVVSARKTGRLLVVDNAWTNCGASAEIALRVIETLQGEREVRIKRMGFAPVPCPPSKPLEELFYPNSQTIAEEAYALVHDDKQHWTPPAGISPEVAEFKGPF
jgi:pyruvate/2-oxoglutarate/acetoin dehydrogenase E1 component